MPTVCAGSCACTLGRVASIAATSKLSVSRRVLLRCRGGGPGTGMNENAWSQRLAEWEGENGAPVSMNDEESHRHELEPPAPEAPDPTMLSSDDMSDSSASSQVVQGMISASSGQPAAQRVPLVPVVEDQALERVRRASVINELLSMGADIRRAGSNQSVSLHA